MTKEEQSFVDHRLVGEGRRGGPSWRAKRSLSWALSKGNLVSHVGRSSGDRRGLRPRDAKGVALAVLRPPPRPRPSPRHRPPRSAAGRHFRPSLRLPHAPEEFKGTPPAVQAADAIAA